MIASIAQVAQNSSSQDLGTYTQTLFQSIIGIDVVVALKILGVWVFVIWMIFALWVAIDAVNRYKQWPVAVFWFIFVLPFNVLGFIGYLFMRPVVTLEEKQWTKLESKYLMYELSSVNDCPNCKTLVPVGHNFCAVCGAQMNVNCPKCNDLQSIYNEFCSNCGTRLMAEERKEQLVAAEKTAETKTTPAEISPKKLTLGERFMAVVSKAKSSVSAGATSFMNVLAPKKKEAAKSDEKKEPKAENKGKKNA